MNKVYLRGLFIYVLTPVLIVFVVHEMYLEFILGVFDYLASGGEDNFVSAEISLNFDQIFSFALGISCVYLVSVLIWRSFRDKLIFILVNSVLVTVGLTVSILFVRREVVSSEFPYGGVDLDYVNFHEII